MAKVTIFLNPLSRLPSLWFCLLQVSCLDFSVEGWGGALDGMVWLVEAGGSALSCFLVLPKSIREADRRCQENLGSTLLGWS